MTKKNIKIKIIAEIGWNHMGNMQLAEKMIKSASKNGADICKFQTWNVKKLKPGPWDSDGRREIYKKAELTEEKHKVLQKICKKNKIEFLTSIFNTDDIGFLSKLNNKIIKIPSHEIGNIDLIKKVEKKFKTILISTGASKWNEILKITKNLNKKKIVLMHCVSSYPCPFDRINLQRLKSLSKFSRVGYSGHLQGIDDAISAISMNALYVEKHFTINNDLPGRDNKFAITPDQLGRLSEFRDNFELMMIDRGLNLQKSEIDTYKNYRGRWSNN